jgi:cytochrome P450
VAPGSALERVVLAAFARVLFGIEEDHAAFAPLAAGYDVLRAQSLSEPLAAPTRAALDDLRALVERRAVELAAGRARGERCVCALDEMRRAAPEMPDGVCVDNLLFILKVASDNVTALLRWLVKMLGDHPQWKASLRAEVDGMAGRDAAPALVDRIVMETLRLEQSEYLYRVIREEFEHASFRFPAGWHLRICVRESHRSAEHWPDPAAFDPDRFSGRAMARSQYSPFGFHQHACNGVDLSNMICRVVLEELATGYDWSIVRDGEVERGFRHWSHWRPSSRLRIAIAPRAEALRVVAGASS